MKRFICLTLGVIFSVLCFCGCAENGEPNGSSVSSGQTSVPDESAVSNGSSVPLDMYGQTSVPDESAVTNSEETADDREKPVVTPSLSSVQVGPYTVYDPDNTRSINNDKVGYSFGVAKNGQPHNISVNNQKYFDSVPQYKALALDTVSEEKCMYLTFDCGYEYQGLTGQILDVLKEKNVKAAFFCTLGYLKSNPEFVRRMIDEGHIVGNHSANHPVFPDVSRQRMAEEIYKVEEYLQTEFNYKSDYFRYPTGAYSENSLELVSSMGYRSIFWSVAHNDWDTANQQGAEQAFATVTARYHPGAVILLHAVSRDNAEALGRMIDKAREDGYTLRSLDEYYK